MALRPGRCLLISSHFMPSPRSWMIFASSSTDHLDCFLAGDSDASVDDLSAGRFAGMTEDVEVAVSALDDVDCAAMLDGAESDRANDGGGDGLDADDASSSFGLSSREISTLEEWCQDWLQGYEEVGRFG